MKITVLRRACQRGVMRLRYRPEMTSGPAWTVEDSMGGFMFILWKDELINDETWRHA
jgi:hypothetical protein